MSDFTFILNPEAGRGSASRVWRRAERLLHSRGILYDVLRTKAAGDAVRMARGATGSVVVAVGGDGTANEVANGLMGSRKTMGIIPAGSGNDMIKSLGIPSRVEGAVDLLLEKKVVDMDVGTVRCSGGNVPASEPEAERERYFVNGVGVGFDAAVAVRTREIRFLSGTALYLLAAFQTLGKYDSPSYDVTFDGTERSSRNLLMAIGNGFCAGGGFFLTPDARVDDGLFDLCVVERASVRRILLLMPLAMRGKHGSAPEVKFYRAKTITIKSESRFYVHADGEIVGRRVSELHISLLPKALTVIGNIPQ
jgi:YegS/Rv2252/BmrU family lipid kinase